MRREKKPEGKFVQISNRRFAQCCNAATFVIRIEQYSDTTPAGRIFHVFSKEAIPFCGYAQMILKLESFMDKTNYPMRYMEARRFFPENKPQPKGFDELMDIEPLLQEELEERSRSSQANSRFLLHVMFRQNASWQGEITLINKESGGHACRLFRSVLDLIHLMESVLQRCTDDKELEIAE